jgi:hypothetical protein
VREERIEIRNPEELEELLEREYWKTKEVVELIKKDS